MVKQSFEISFLKILSAALACNLLWKNLSFATRDTRWRHKNLNFATGTQKPVIKITISDEILFDT